MSFLDSIIGAGASLLGASMQSDASEEAAKIQKKASQQALAEQKRQFDIQQQNLAPWLGVGSEAQYKLADLLGLTVPQNQYGVTSAQGKVAAAQAAYDKASKSKNKSKLTAAKNALDLANAELAQMTKPQAAPSSEFGSLMHNFTNADFVEEPGYQFRLSEGLKGIDRMAAARGGWDSGATLKALDRFNQDYASNEFQNAWNRDQANKTSKYNFLTGTAGGGQNAANTLGSFGANYANNAGELLTGAGNARAASVVGGANAWGNALNNITQQMTLAQIMNGSNKNPAVWMNPDTGVPWYYGNQ